MTKRQIPVIAAVLLLCVFLAGCPNYPLDREKIGKGITNYPAWATMPCYGGFGLSTWKEWQSKEMEVLRSHVPESLAIQLNNGRREPIRQYTGYCRLIVERQILSLEFDNGSICTLLYIFIGNLPRDDHETFIDIPQPDLNQFNYNGIIRHGYEGTDIGFGECRMQRLEEENGKSHFSYKLTIDGMVVVDEKMYAYQEGWFNSHLNTRHHWMPMDLYKSTTASSADRTLQGWAFQSQQGCISGYWSFRTSWDYFYTFPTARVYDVCFPNTMITMKEISVDNATQKAVYRLFDGAPGAPQYVELHRDTDATVKFTWFNLPEGQQDAATNRIDLREETLYVQKN